MCGRYTHLYTWPEIVDWMQLMDLFQQVEPPPADSPEALLTYNLAPTCCAWVVQGSGPQRVQLWSARWGFAPAWARGPVRPINARSESAASSGLFRAALKQGRIVVPAGGWFEWRAEADGKQPYYFHLPEGPLWMAGILTHDAGNDPNFALLTGAEVPACRGIHDRSPVLLEGAELAAWLDPSTAPETVAALMQPGSAVAARVQVRKVGRAVNNARNDGAGLIEALADPP